MLHDNCSLLSSRWAADTYRIAAALFTRSPVALCTASDSRAVAVLL